MSSQTLGTGRFLWRMATFRPWIYIGDNFLWTAMYCSRLLPGLIAQQAFDEERFWSGQAQPAARPARIVLPPLGYASFLPGDPEMLQAVGLARALTPGMSLNLVFEFSNGAAPLTVQAPVAVPLSPAPPASAIPGENVEPGG